MNEPEPLKQRSILLSDRQMKLLETHAERNGGRRANVSASSIIRALVDNFEKETKKKISH